MNLHSISKSLLIALPMLALAACSSTGNVDEHTQKTEQPVEQAAVDNNIKTDNVGSIKQATKLTDDELMIQKYGNEISENVIYFDFDKSKLKPEFNKRLLAHAAYLKDHADKSIIVEGHTDEQGTPEYNKLLGERRALTVVSYLEDMGVESEQITSTSYGAENPANIAHNDAAWAQNRRVELVF